MKLGYNEAEAVAPDSENTVIAEHVISAYKLKYKNICIMFDNDEAGINAMKNYEMKYDIKSALLPLSKDLSDSIRDYGIRKVQEVLTPILKQALQ
jgi:DNA primase